MQIINENNTKSNTETTGSINTNDDPIQAQKEVIGKEIKQKNFSEDDVKKYISGFVENLGRYNSDEHRKEIMRTMKELTYRCEAILETKECEQTNTKIAQIKKIVPQRDFLKKRKISDGKAQNKHQKLN